MSWLGLFLVGGWVGVDATSFLQAMVSRPLVAGAMTGLLVGNPTGGVIVGAVLEAFQLAIMPIGAARVPEPGTATVAASAAYAAVAGTALDAPVLLFAVLFGLAWGRIAGGTVVSLRRMNERLVERAVAGPRPARALERWHRAAIAFDFLRAGFVSVTGAAVGAVIVNAFAGLWLLPPGVALSALAVATTALIAGTVDLFGGWRDRQMLLLIGLLCGSLLVVFT